MPKAPRKPEFPATTVINRRHFVPESHLEWFKAALLAFSLGKPYPPMPKSLPPGDRFRPIKAAAEELGVGRRTAGRWLKQANEQRAAAGDRAA